MATACTHTNRVVVQREISDITDGEWEKFLTSSERGYAMIRVLCTRDVVAPEMDN